MSSVRSLAKSRRSITFRCDMQLPYPWFWVGFPIFLPMWVDWWWCDGSVVVVVRGARCNARCRRSFRCLVINVGWHRVYRFRFKTFATRAYDWVCTITDHKRPTLHVYLCRAPETYGGPAEVPEAAAYIHTKLREATAADPTRNICKKWTDTRVRLCGSSESMWTEGWRTPSERNGAQVGMQTTNAEKTEEGSSFSDVSRKLAAALV